MRFLYKNDFLNFKLKLQCYVHDVYYILRVVLLVIKTALHKKIPHPIFSHKIRKFNQNIVHYLLKIINFLIKICLYYSRTNFNVKICLSAFK